MKDSAFEVPPAVVTVTATPPATSAGDVTVTAEHDPSTDTPVPGTAPKSTTVGSHRPLPVNVTTVPPPTGPDDGEITPSVGAGTPGEGDGVDGGAVMANELLVAEVSPVLVALKV